MAPREPLHTAKQNLEKDDQELSEIRGEGQENIKSENCYLLAVK